MREFLLTGLRIEALTLSLVVLVGSWYSSRGEDYMHGTRHPSMILADFLMLLLSTSELKAFQWRFWLIDSRARKVVVPISWLVICCECNVKPHSKCCFKVKATCSSICICSTMYLSSI